MVKQDAKRKIALSEIPEITTQMQSKSICAIFGILTLVAILAITPHAFAATTNIVMSPGAGADQSCVAAKNCFSPNEVNIAVGDTVTWTNNDMVGHTATSGTPTDNQTGTVWDSNVVAPGKSYSFNFQTTGNYRYFCVFHPWMTGEIIVEETVTPTPPTTTPPTPPTPAPVEMGQNGYCPQSVDQKYCHKVIIIGAGMAGLGAANELKSHGYDYIILEMGHKAGGRVNTLFYSPDNVTKIPYDTHASLISGTVGNPITELANLYHIKYQQTDYTNATYYDNNGSINDKNRIANLNSSSLYSDFKTNFLDKYRQNKADEPLNIAISKYNDTLSGTDKTDFSYEAASYIGAEYANDPDAMSLKYWDKIGYRVGGDNAVDSTFPNGFSQIVDGLVKDVGNDTIQYNTKVTNVTYNSHGVSVTTNQGTTYYGKYVISTIAINLLRNNGIQFTPSLPDDKTYAINNMTMGTLSQTYLYFKNGVFWDNVQWIYYVPPFNETGHWTTFENMYPVNGAPMLLAENYGRFAIQVITENQNQLKKDLVRVLDHMYPGKVSAKDIEIVYRGEPLSYSSVPVNFTVPEDFDILASPVPDDKGVDRVFFAGEATTWHSPQTTHGAYITGLREANRVMITDTGHYPYPSWQEKNWRYPVENDGKNRWQSYPEYVICKDHLILANKTSDGSLVCITNDTLNKVSNYANKWVEPITLP